MTEQSMVYSLKDKLDMNKQIIFELQNEKQKELDELESQNKFLKDILLKKEKILEEILRRQRIQNKEIIELRAKLEIFEKLAKQ